MLFSCLQMLLFLAFRNLSNMSSYFAQYLNRYTWFRTVNTEIQGVVAMVRCQCLLSESDWFRGKVGVT